MKATENRIVSTIATLFLRNRISAGTASRLMKRPLQNTATIFEKRIYDRAALFLNGSVQTLETSFL